MENLNVMEQRSLVDELTQGRELAKQLKNEICPLTSKETCQQIIQKILSSYDKALACLNFTELLQKYPSPNVGLIESPESSDGASTKIGCARDQSHRDVFKKRKTLPRWSKHVKVCSGTGLEGPLDDGHSWRKYGQKDILGATNPRAYYRCTHKYSRGCIATKQVQKTDKDPLIFEVTYRGKHTCMNVPNSPLLNNLLPQPEANQNQKQNIPFEFGQGLKVEPEETTTPKDVGHIPSFSTKSQNEDIWEQFEENNILLRAISPATSASICPYDMISTPTSGTSSLFDFNMDPVEGDIEPNLSFDVLEFLEF